MNWKDNEEIARRIAELSPCWTFDEALSALEEGGEAREDMLGLLRSREEGLLVREELAEARRNLRRYRLGLL
jgi:hypothetical protein